MTSLTNEPKEPKETAWTSWKKEIFTNRESSRGQGEKY